MLQEQLDLGAQIDVGEGIVGDNVGVLAPGQTQQQRRCDTGAVLAGSAVEQNAAPLILRENDLKQIPVMVLVPDDHFGVIFPQTAHEAGEAVQGFAQQGTGDNPDIPPVLKGARLAFPFAGGPQVNDCPHTGLIEGLQVCLGEADHIVCPDKPSIGSAAIGSGVSAQVPYIDGLFEIDAAKSVHEKNLLCKLDIESV